MFLRSVTLAAAIAMALPAFAQEEQPQAEPAERQAIPRGSRAKGDNPTMGTAVPRGERQPAIAAAPAVRVGAEERARDRGAVVNRGKVAPMPVFAQNEQPAERQAVPRGSRPQGDNPRMGTAVPRGERQPATAPSTAAPAVRNRAEERQRDRGGVVNRGSTVIVNPPPIYNYNNRYYTYPRRLYPHGYGAFGLGYFYYDPYRWYPGYYSNYGYGPGYYPRYGSGFGFDIGELRLQVFPRNAQVFVDGYYAGTVDDFDGTFQALKLEAGPYQIRIAAPGFEDLMFDVRINPGQKINYRGELRRRP